MTLRTLFAIPITIILLVTLSLAGMIAGQGWSGLERGRAATAAVERLRILLELQGALVTERITANVVLSAVYPLPKAQALRLGNARENTDQQINSLLVNLRAAPKDARGSARLEPRVLEILVRLSEARSALDALLAAERPSRTLDALNALMPLMLAPAQSLEQRLTSATLEIIAAEPGMAGLLAVTRISSALRDQLSGIAGVMMPRFNRNERMTAAEIAVVHRLLGVASQLTLLLTKTIEIAAPTERMRVAVAALTRSDESGELLKLGEIMQAGPVDIDEETGFLRPQQILIPWGIRLTEMRLAILDATVVRVVQEQKSREGQLYIVMVAFGAVLVAVLESVALLSTRVVRPLAQLGLAITRIAAGDRNVPLNLQSGTREMVAMATAVETLRQAALVADAAAMRQRLAARQRLVMLREALGIAQTVQEPAHALERDVAKLCEKIDATIALVTVTNTPPQTLGVAAVAVRASLAEMRRSAAGLDATFAAASGAQTEDRPPEEFVAHIRAVAAEIDRRDIAVHGFITPSLVALRDATSATGETPAQALRDLVSDQFECIETTVAMVASMRAAMMRAATIVRDLPLDETPMAA